MNDREGAPAALYRAPRADLKLADFRVEAHLGDGSFSTVVLASMKATGARYAIKIVNKSLVVRNKMVRAEALRAMQRHDAWRLRRALAKTLVSAQ